MAGFFIKNLSSTNSIKFFRSCAIASFNACIKFSLNIKDKNIVFLDFFNKFINGKAHKVYLAKLIQSACPFCDSLNLKHNGHYLSNIHYITADASPPVILKLKK